MLFAARREAAEAQATLAAVRKWRDKHYGLVPSPIDATLFAAAPSASLDAATREAAARALEEAAEQMYDARDQRMLRARAASMREGAPL
jgi:malic enzyme